MLGSRAKIASGWQIQLKNASSKFATLDR